MLATRLSVIMCAALLALFPAAHAPLAQSLLSDSAEVWRRLPSADAPAQAASAAGKAAGLALDGLFALVDAGKGRQAYAPLIARWEELLAETEDEGTDLEQWNQLLLIYLLRAGEGLAPPEMQEHYARQFTESYPGHEQFPLAFYYLTRAQYRLGRPLQDSFFFDSAALTALPPWMQTRYLLTRAESAFQHGNVAAAARYRLQEMHNPTGLRWSTREDVVDLLEQIPDSATLQTFMETHAEIEWLQSRRRFLAVRVLINEGRLAPAMLALLVLRDEEEDFDAAQLKLLDDTRREFETVLHTRSTRIGVILPLSSNNRSIKALARATLDGLRMAVQFPGGASGPREALARRLGMDLAPRQETKGARHAPAARFELVIRDSGNSPELAARHVESLTKEDQVIAIVGPIARAESEAAAVRAEELGVPLISFSISLVPPKGARFVFRHSKSREEEVRDLVRYAMDYLNARRFVIVYPDNRYGRTMMHLFWRSVADKGGRVIGAAPFRPPSRNPGSRQGLGLKRIFDNITGVDRPLDAAEQQLLDAVGDTRPDPIVDFDAIYIPLGPDAGRYFRLISAYPVTVDAENVQLLGSRFWNDNAVLVAGEGKMVGAVFVDSYDRFGNRNAGRAFRRRHRNTFGHRPDYRPPTYYTGLGYDTFNLLRSLITSTGLRSRGELSQALVTMEPYAGITGLTSFLESGEAVKESMFFRVARNRITRVFP